MAAVTLTLGVPKRETLSSTSNQSRRVVLPGTPCWLRIFSASDCYLELKDVTDNAALGTDYETILANTTAVRRLAQSVVGVAGAAASQVVELTAFSSEG